MSKTPASVHVSIPVIPDATVSTVTGLYDVLAQFNTLVSGQTRFEVDIVSHARRLQSLTTGLPFNAHRTVDEIEHTDIVILPSVLLSDGNWRTGRYPKLVTWMKSMYEQGATLCSACSGVLLLAETGLLNGGDATMHWVYARTFRENFPEINLKLEKVLVIGGADQRFIMSGAAASWHDLVLYLIARYAGPEAAQTVAKFFLLQWHTDGQAPYIIFQEEMDHGDAAIVDAQKWLRANLGSSNPIEEVVRYSGLPERSFKRRFRKATGLTPISYIQNLRVEAAKRQLETSDTAVDDISYSIGYEEPAFFRRLFKRTTGLTPSAYRRKFQVPLVEGIVKSTNSRSTS